MQKTLGVVTVICEHQSEVIKNRIFLMYTFFLLFGFDESNKLE